MQIKKMSKKIVAVVLVALVVSSGVSSTISLADSAEVSEEITIINDEGQIEEEDVVQEDELPEEAIDTDDVVKILDENNGKMPYALEDEQVDSLRVEVEDKAVKTAFKPFNGLVKVDGKWEFFKDSIRVRKWVELNGVTYYFLNTHKMPQNMWRMIKGHLYYFNKDGVMIRDQKISIDGKIYQFNKEGHKVPVDNTKELGVVTPEQQEIYKKGEQNLIDAQNVKKEGILKEDGKWYKYVNGERTRGWYTVGNNTYFFLNTRNRAENMWRKIKGVIYHFDENGIMTKDCIRYIDGKTFKFDKNGALIEKASTSFVTKDVKARMKADDTSQVLGSFKAGNGIEIVRLHGDYAQVKNASSTVIGWIPKSAYMGLSEQKINKVIEVAKSKLGNPYVWGATGPYTFDCSGLMLYSFRHGAGVNLPRVSRDQAKAGRYVSRKDLRAGDMIFWGNPVHHVGLYIGDGKYIHAPEPGVPVKISYLGRYATARRVIE